MNRRSFIKQSIAGVGGAILISRGGRAASASRLKGAFRRPVENGWTFVHLEGSPGDIGFQHGYLLYDRIEDAFKVTRLEQTHDAKYHWGFFREKARTMMWPHVEQEYRDEMRGIAEGLRARGSKLDLWDVVALNGSMEWSYYLQQHEKRKSAQDSSARGSRNRLADSAGSREHSASLAALTAPDHCSAFAATGSFTKDGRVVLAHNNWTLYLDGERWTIIYDIEPANGYRILMDGYPGFIHSGDDYGINSAGIMITETTLSDFVGYDPRGIPEFVRARKAMQYSASIDDFARIMK